MDRRVVFNHGVRFVVALVALLLVLPVVPSWAQETTGRIEGVVQDSTGGVLPGATVEAKNLTTGIVTPATTDSKGAYRFPALKPGKYEVVVRMQGMAPAKSPVFEVALGSIKVVNLDLGVGEMTAEIKVTGEAPLIDVKQSASAVSISDELIKSLPHGRNFRDVLFLAPGTNNESKLAGDSIDGSSGAENRYIIDGLDTTDLRTGQSGKSLVVDFIDEVQVKSSGFAAEYGGATGGVVNVVTKSGGEVLAGDFGAYYSADWLDGGERPTLRIDPETDSVAEYITYPKDTYDRIEPGFGLGGAIVHNKLWYFGSYVPQITNNLRDVTFSSNGSSGTFREYNRTHFGTGNVTAQLSNTVRGRWGMSLSGATSQGNLPERDGTSNPVFDWAGLDEDTPNLSTSGNLDWNPTSTLFFSFKGGYFRTDFAQEGIPDQVWNTIIGNMRAFPEIPQSLIRNSGFSTIPTNSASSKDIQTRTSFGVDATYFASFGGEHTFKTGVQFDRIGNDVQRGYQEPRVVTFYDRSLTTLDGQRVRGRYGYTRVFSIVTTGDIKSNNVGLFLQDDWTINRHLTVNLGVRTESEKVPSYRTDLGQAENAIDFGFSDKLAPRLGFAYDVLADGRWKAYGSWGVFHDITKLEMPRGSFGGDQWLDYRYSLDDYDWTSYYVPGCPPACPGTFYEVVDFRHPSNDPNDPTIDPELKPMRSQELTLGLQHELSRGMRFGVRYVHKHLVRTIEDVGIIVPGIGEVFYIANPGFGVAEFTNPGYPAQPKAKRDYDGVELDFTRRMSNKWSLHATYTWSRLTGNYSGLASSDEDGRSSPNVNRFFDSIVMSFDQDGNPVFGNLTTDRPHQFKLQAVYELPWGATVSGNWYIRSGIPVSRQVSVQSSTPVFYLGRESDGRTPSLWSFDLFFAKDFRFEGGRSLQLSMNVQNLFDSDDATGAFNTYTRDIIGIDSLDEFFGDFDVEREIAEQEIRIDPRFKQANAFQGARSVRLGMKYAF